MSRRVGKCEKQNTKFFVKLAIVATKTSKKVLDDAHVGSNIKRMKTQLTFFSKNPETSIASCSKLRISFPTGYLKNRVVDNKYKLSTENFAQINQDASVRAWPWCSLFRHCHWLLRWRRKRFAHVQTIVQSYWSIFQTYCCYCRLLLMQQSSGSGTRQCVGGAAQYSKMYKSSLLFVVLACWKTSFLYPKVTSSRVFLKTSEMFKDIRKIVGLNAVGQSLFSIMTRWFSMLDETRQYSKVMSSRLWLCSTVLQLGFLRLFSVREDFPLPRVSRFCFLLDSSTQNFVNGEIFLEMLRGVNISLTGTDFCLWGRKKLSTMRHNLKCPRKYKSLWFYGIAVLPFSFSFDIFQVLRCGRRSFTLKVVNDNFL